MDSTRKPLKNPVVFQETRGCVRKYRSLSLSFLSSPLLFSSYLLLFSLSRQYCNRLARLCRVTTGLTARTPSWRLPAATRHLVTITWNLEHTLGGSRAHLTADDFLPLKSHRRALVGVARLSQWHLMILSRARAEFRHGFTRITIVPDERCSPPPPPPSYSSSPHPPSSPLIQCFCEKQFRSDSIPVTSLGWKRARDESHARRP